MPEKAISRMDRMRMSRLGSETAKLTIANVDPITLSNYSPEASIHPNESASVVSATTNLSTLSKLERMRLSKKR